jgi:hypothetical protein
MEKGNFDIGKWFPNHGGDKTTPPLMKVIDGLKAKGITTFGATGFCRHSLYDFLKYFTNCLIEALEVNCVNSPLERA